MFKAPWGRQVRIATLVSSVVLMLVAALPFLLGGRAAMVPGLLSVVVCAGILGGTALTGVYGYVVTKDAIGVRRLGRTTWLPLEGLQGVEVAPDVMAGSCRVMGNGGIFALTGRFRNERLGSYRALVTDMARTVVLRYADHCVVVSPDRPTEFAAAIGVPLVAARSIATASAGGRPWKYAWLALIPLAILGAVATMLYMDSRPLDVQLDAERLRIDGGTYDVDLPLAQIRDAELLDSRPQIVMRTNGFAAGQTLRGYFNVTGLGNTRVFTDADTGPYLLIQSEEGPVLLALRDSSETRQLAESLSTQVPLP